MKIEFKEAQKFQQWWLKLIFILIGIIPIWGIYTQLIKGEVFGNKPMSDFGLIIFSIFIFALIIMLWSMRLKTEIDENEIRVYFFPFLKKRILWKDVESAEVINYGFVGGWGIRYSAEYGTVYNISGNKGLAILLKNGKKLCIGTQKETELEKVVTKIER